MPILELYLIFCLATALTARIEIFSPVIEDLKILNPESPFVVNPYITAMVTTAATMIVAPFMFVMCIVPRMGKQFRESLLDILSE